MRVIMLLLLALMVAVPLAGPAWAVQPDEILADPALEARARAISKEVRCLVCRNESIDDSNAELARDLRLLVRERLVAELKASHTGDQRGRMHYDEKDDPARHRNWTRGNILIGIGLQIVFQVMP